MPTIGSSCGSPASRSCISFGIRSVKALKTRPETTAISSSTITARRTSGGGISGKGRAAAWRGRVVRRLDAARPTPSPKQNAPARRRPRASRICCGEERGHDRRQRDAEIAEHAVDADRAPDPVARRLDQHRGADRVVDRREQPRRGQRQGERQRASMRSPPPRAQARCRRRTPPSWRCGRTAPRASPAAASRRRRARTCRSRARGSAHIRTPNSPSGRAIASTAVGRIRSE